ncbi:MAG: hypothetical protein MSD82_10585 [Prevotella sp.]|nr:hypothetical protein [Prevotella sp.]
MTNRKNYTAPATERFCLIEDACLLAGSGTSPAPISPSNPSGNGESRNVISDGSLNGAISDNIWDNDDSGGTLSKGASLWFTMD